MNSKCALRAARLNGEVSIQERYCAEQKDASNQVGLPPRRPLGTVVIKGKLGCPGKRGGGGCGSREGVGTPLACNPGRRRVKTRRGMRWSYPAKTFARPVGRSCEERLL